MSRCFPFPPPGYDERKKNKVLLSSDEALINESIKREQEKAEKERRKEKKREKKEKKKEKKEKKEKERKEEEKSGLNGEVVLKIHNDKHGEVVLKIHNDKHEGAKADHKFIDYQKKKECETEHLERSGLSEEHEQPCIVPRHSDSSDSTQNSGKRKRQQHSLPLQSSSQPETQTQAQPRNQNQSTTLRIRLPLAKQRDPPKVQLLSSSSSGAHKVFDICSTSGRGEIGPSPGIKQPCSSSAGHVLGAQKMFDVNPKPRTKQSRSTSGKQPCSSSAGLVVGAHKVFDIGAGPSTRQSCSTSGRAEIDLSASIRQPAGAHEMFDIISKPSTESELREMIENWAPPPMDVEGSGCDEQEWLFDVSKREPKRIKASDVVVVPSSLWPRACYLPEAEIYALPFTVPF